MLFYAALAIAAIACLAIGALGGFFVGAIVGIARIRRMLATDDELLLRQRRLGFDPEHAASWIRGRAQS